MDLARDPSPDVRVQLAVSAGRLQSPDGLPLLEALLLNSDNAADPLIPTILYNNLKPLASGRGEEILAFLEKNPSVEQAFGKSTAGWIRQAINASGRDPRKLIAELSTTLSSAAPDDRILRKCQEVLDALSQSGLKNDQIAALFDPPTRQAVVSVVTGKSDARVPATILAMTWKDSAAQGVARNIVGDAAMASNVRVQTLVALTQIPGPENITAVSTLISDSNVPVPVRQAAIDALGSMNDPAAADVLVSNYTATPADLKPMVINALTHSDAAANGAGESG